MLAVSEWDGRYFTVARQDALPSVQYRVSVHSTWGRAHREEKLQEHVGRQQPYQEVGALLQAQPWCPWAIETPRLWLVVPQMFPGWFLVIMFSREGFQPPCEGCPVWGHSFLFILVSSCLPTCSNNSGHSSCTSWDWHINNYFLKGETIRVG